MGIDTNIKNILHVISNDVYEYTKATNLKKHNRKTRRPNIDYYSPKNVYCCVFFLSDTPSVCGKLKNKWTTN